MAKLNNERVDAIYKKLSAGRSSRPGEWNIERRTFAQKIVHIEEACKSVLAAIERLEKAGPNDDLGAIERDLRTEFSFLDTLQE